MTVHLETKPTAARRPRAVVYRGTVLATADVAATPEQVYRALTTEAGHGWADSGIPGGGIVVEVDPPRMIVQKLKPRGDSEETTVTFSLASVSSGTRVTVRHEGFANERVAAEEYMRGWEEALAGIQSRLGREFQPESPQGGAHVEIRQDHT